MKKLFIISISLFVLFAISLFAKEGCGIIKYVGEYWSDEVGDPSHIQNATIQLQDLRNDFCFHTIAHSWNVLSLETDAGTNYHSTASLYGNPETITTKNQ